MLQKVQSHMVYELGLINLFMFLSKNRFTAEVIILLN